MLHWQLSGKHKFLAQLFCIAAAGHSIALFLIFFVYRGDLYERRLTINIPLNAHIVLLPFQKSVLGHGSPARPKSAQENSSPSQTIDPSDENDSDKESGSEEQTIESAIPLTGQKTFLDNGELARKKRAKEREIKRKKKLAQEKKEKALKEKKKKEEAKKKAIEEKKKAEQKAADEKKAAEEKKKQKQNEEIAKKKEAQKVEPAKDTPIKNQKNDSGAPDTRVPSQGEFGEKGSEHDAPGDGEPFYVGQYDLETLQLAQEVAAEIAQVWRPPAGFKNKNCTVRCVLDWDGTMISLAFEQSSGSTVFDISVKQAINKMKFPKELYGKEIILPFTA